MITTILIGFVLLFSMMAFLWLVSMRISNAAVVDVGWGAGFFLFAGIAYALTRGGEPRTILLAAMVMLWSGRLGLHLLRDRVLSGSPEDERYSEIRRRWKSHLNLKFFLFFQLQAVLIAVLSIPMLIVMENPAPGLSIFEWSGILLWLAALIGEAEADRQLALFKRNPENKGKVCQSGLWNYSRHPNYFFEWLVWVAYFVFALGSPYGWLSIGGPVIMFVILTRLTGIPLTEEHALRSRGEAYRAYQKSTSPFVPWMKRRARS